MQQSTIAQRISCTGSGLHSGQAVDLTLCPALAGSGVVFVSLGAGADGSDVEIPARVDAVQSTSRATTLAAVADGSRVPTDRPVRISTVEHLLATLLALEIDNVRVEVRGPEIPVMDGSAAPFVEWVRSAGRVSQGAPRPEITVEEPITICEGDRSIRALPARGLQISYAIDFAHPSIGRQSIDIPSLDEKVFERELAAARTFGFANEVADLHQAGLARGGSIENTLVLDDHGILSSGGLRWPDEFVRHKVIDLIGDLALLGASLNAHVLVEKGGHRLHHQMVRALEARFAS